MGGSSGSSTSTYSPPPEVAAAYKQLLSNSQPLFTAPYQPYTAGKAETASDMVPLTVAPQTPNQVAAGQNIASLAGYYQPYANAATDLVQQGTQPIGLQQFNNQSVSQYMSPFLQNVMGSTVANINETNAQQQQQVLGNAIAKGAYGGDRSGIAQSELARQQNLANNATLANVANTGYNSALGQFNQMNQQGIQAQLGSGQLAQSGANLLGNLGTMGQNAALQQAQAQYGIGGAQQQQSQAELSTAYQNYLNQIAYPYQQAQFEGGLISGVASGSGGTTTSTPAQPGAANQIIGGLGALGSLGSLFGGSGAAGAAGAGGFGSFLGSIGSGIGAAAGGIGEGIGAAGAGLLGLFSDERVKENIHPVGKTFDGQNIYKYNYKGDPTTQIGLIAQEVEHKHPSAVGQSQGYKTVNYDEATKNAEHRGHFAAGGDVQQQQGLLGVSPIAGMTATSYLPNAQNAMANPHMPQAPQAKNPNADMYSNLASAVKSVKSMMGKPDDASKTTPTDTKVGVNPNIVSDPSQMGPFMLEMKPEAFGGRIHPHHYDVGGAATAHPDTSITADSPHSSDSFSALKASQQHFTQSLPNAGVVPTPKTSTGVTGGAPSGTPIDANGPALHNPALARSNYTTLATSGNASLADLQSAYDLYTHAHATPEAITQVQLGGGTTDKTNTPVSNDSGGSGAEGGGGGGNNAAGGRIHNHHYGSGGGVVNYIGMPTKKSLQEGAENVVGSGESGGDPTLASIASQDYLPEQAARGGVIGREHHAGPDDTNDQSNVVGKGAGVAAVAPEESATTGVAKSNIFEGLNPNSRAAKNNNPGNIIDSGFARSQPGYAGTDGRFARFETPEHGEAAMHGLLQNYQKQGITTPAGIISKWAPASDNNDTGGYIAQVAKKLGVSPNDPIDVTDPKIRDILGKTIATVEAGAAGPNDGSATSNRIAPAAGAQQKTQPQMPAGITQTPTKEGLSGMLGISMTDNQRLAAFNAFAKLAGTPGKFGVGLAAAADTYSKTLMEANKQTLEQAKGQAEVKKAGVESFTKGAQPSPLGGMRILEQNQAGDVTGQKFVPGATAEQPNVSYGQGAAGAAGGAGPSGGQVTSGAAPTAPTSPTEAAPKISIPQVAGTPDPDAAIKPYVARDLQGQFDPDTRNANRQAFEKLNEPVQQAASSAYDAKKELATVTKALAGLREDSLAGAGPALEVRTSLAKTINYIAQLTGNKELTADMLKDVTMNDLLFKVSTMSAQNSAWRNEAGFMIDKLRQSYPSGSITPEAARELLASLYVSNQLAMDKASFYNQYGSMTGSMGRSVQDAFSRAVPASAYDTERRAILGALTPQNITNPQGQQERASLASALAKGYITHDVFNARIKQLTGDAQVGNLGRYWGGSNAQ